MIEIDGNSLTLEELHRAAVLNEKITLQPSAVQAIEDCRKRVDKIIQTGLPVYGINTGFGIFADTEISSLQTRRLNRNLVLSHAVGTGPDLHPEIVRAAMLIRANTLAKGYSGVRLVVVQTLLDMLNQGVTPCIPSQGSLGSSGDLAPLSHLALVLTRDEQDLPEQSGRAEFRGRVSSGKEAMELAGLERIILEAKEGLALNNGATFSAAIGALVCYRARKLLANAEIALAMSLEGLAGISSAFDSRVHEARQHPGQIAFAERVRNLTAGSTLLDSAPHVQDAYSLRCSPQVHGPARETLEFSERIICREINAATDNPLIFPDEEAISGGNFHGQPVGLVMDFLGIALAEIAGISERRIYRMTDGHLNNNLPPMLVDNREAAGLNSGMMMPQYTAASLVLENRALAGPDSLYSLPTSASQEDHNANAMTAARHTLEIVNNTCHVLAIEIYTAARALDLRLRQQPHLKPGAGTQAAHRFLREHVPYQAGDTLWGPEIDRVRSLIEGDEFLPAVEAALA